MRALIAVLAGDGIGPEVVAQGARVLRAVGRKFGHEFELQEAPVGGSALDTVGVPLPDATMDLCKRSDAILLGAVGGPKWDSVPVASRPEQSLLGLRKGLGLFANLRPVSTFPKLLEASSIKPHLLKGLDFLVVRELTGGIYFGEKKREGDRASDLCVYTVAEVERVVRMAGRLAAGRRGKITSVDKANVLETSRLWRATTERVLREEFPAIKFEHMLVDAAAMHLIRRPGDFDVMVTENMFGDILTDEASMLVGSLGMLPSASLGEGRFGLYEPIHGSAPDIAGKGIANPYATILSAALLLRYSLGLENEARCIEAAVARAIEQSVLTGDLILADNAERATTSQVGDAVIALL